MTPAVPVLAVIALAAAGAAMRSPARRRVALLIAGAPAGTGHRRRTLAARLVPPGRLRRHLGDRLEGAGLRVEPEEAAAIWVAGVVGTAVVGWSAGGVALAAVGVAAVVGATPLGLSIGRSRVRHHRRTALRGLLEGVALELRSGGTTTTALTRLASRPGWLGYEASDVLARADLGVGLASALEAWADDRRRHLPPAEVDPTAGALVVSATVGGRAADALDGLAEALSDRTAAEAEARAQSAQGRLSALVVGGLPIASLTFTALFDRGAVGAALSHPLGPPCLAIGAALEVVGVVWMRRIVRVAP